MSGKRSNKHYSKVQKAMKQKLFGDEKPKKITNKTTGWRDFETNIKKMSQTPPISNQEILNQTKKRSK